MDEITLLASSLPDAPPPSPEVVARARDRLTAPESRRSPHGRRHWTWAVATAAATAAVAVAVTAGVGAGGGPATRVATSPSGKQALYDLAAAAERVPEGSGAYWYRKLVDGHLERPLVKGSKSYLIYATTERSSWHPRKAGETTLRQTRTQGRPARPQDESRWRAAGSPTQWRYTEGCLPEEKKCEPAKVTAAPADCRYAWKADPAAIRNGRWDGPLTPGDLDSIPTDPEGLRRFLRPLHDQRRQANLTEEQVEGTYATAGNWLLQFPASPKLQAGVLRMLAELPGTEVLGEVTDPLGRTGLGVRVNTTGRSLSSRVGDEGVHMDWQLVLDRRTGRVLALQHTALEGLPDMAKGTVVGYTLFLEQDWTDQRPEPLKGCRKVPFLP
ncbi:CU044_5270 family protein [Streptosporangium sp. CA-135522]|uniref:CU044_5270 family protein n=1 Tax=Streptosporangium sp. CA-135522 TaxID=3240072 RepID=UPI003D94ED7F